MRLERKFLRSQDHVCGDAASPEQIRSDKGALQAKSLFGIPDAGVVNRRADPFDGDRIRRSESDLPPFDHQVEGIEAANGAQNIVGEQREDSPAEEHQADLPRSIWTPSSWQMNASLSVKASILVDRG